VKETTNKWHRELFVQQEVDTGGDMLTEIVMFQLLESEVIAAATIMEKGVTH
jgi:hypothetical protein